MRHLKTILLVCSILFCILAFSQFDSSQLKIYFKFNSYKLNDSAKNNLNTLIKNFSSDMTYKISGYTDHIGSFLYNDNLSFKRANSVYNYLATKGIPTSNVSEIIGHGKRRLTFNPNITVQKNDELNRCVSIWAFKKISTIKSSNDSFLKNNTDTVKIIVPLKKNNSTVNRFENQLNSGDSLIILDNVNFEKNRHFLLATSLPTLKEVLVALKNNDSLKIEIQGHICCIDSNEVDGMDIDTDERSLSLNRAKAVYDYLVSHGIKSTRLTYKGFGSKKRLVFPELTEYDAIRNRRVEFKIKR